MNSFRVKLRLLFLIVFLLLTSSMIVLVSREAQKITYTVSKNYATLYANEIVGEINGAIQREIALAEKAANTIDIQRWMVSEDNENYKSYAYSELLRFNVLFKDHNIFLVPERSKNFYFLEGETKLNQFSPQGALHEKIAEDIWYFKLKESIDPYMLNIDYDRFLDTLRVWINVKSYVNNQFVGVVGTGLNLDPLLKDIYELRLTEGTKTVIINNFGAIQLDSDKENIKQNSFVIETSPSQTVFQYLYTKKFVDEVWQYLEGPMGSLLIELEHEDYEFVALSPIENTNWHVVTFFNTNALFKLENFYALGLILLLMILILALVLSWSVHVIFIKPLEALNMSILKKGHIQGEVFVGLDRKDEFGVLARSVQKMKIQLDHYNNYLESEIARRTDALDEAYKKISLNEKRLNRLFNDIPLGIFILDEKKNFVYGNPYFISQFGYDSDVEFKNSVTHNFKNMFANNEHYQVYKQILRSEPDHYFFEILLRTKFGELFWAELNLNRVTTESTEWAYEGIMINIQEKKNYESKLIKMAISDKLTGLYNRHHFDQMIRESLQRNKRYGGDLSLIILDLDNFKIINDNFGHDVGDKVLVAVSVLIQKIIRETDTLARWGGEEFVVLLPNTAIKESLIAAEKIRLTLQDFHEIEGVTVTASFGVAQYQTDEDYISWFRRVDVALYHAKNNGKNQVIAAELTIDDSINVDE